MPDTIICPKCRYEIEVTEVLSAQLRTQMHKEFEADFRKKEAAIADREQAVVAARGEVERAKQEIDQRVADRLEKERKTLSEDALRKAREQVTVELRDKDQQLTDIQAKLKAAEDAELVLRKERRDLEEEKRALNLTVARELDEGRAKIYEQAQTEAAQERNFAHIDAVWVTNSSCAISVAHALRSGLLEVAKAQLATEGRQGKMELLYNYLSGTEFRHRVEGIVEAFVTLREDLEAEKRATQKLWAKREKQLERATAQTAGMYGDLSGIIGASLPQIKHLESPAVLDRNADALPAHSNRASSLAARRGTPAVPKAERII